MNPTKMAAIDLGTNSCRLLISDENGNPLYKTAVSTRLGEGMTIANRFTEAAVKRGIDCFCAFRTLMDEYQVKSYRAIATAACRMAENGKEFVQQVKSVSGIDLEVIDGYEEARLNLLGAVSNVKDEQAEYVLIYDLGGGSTEITLATRSLSPRILHTVSIPWGARNSSEKFGLVEYDETKARLLADEIAGYSRRFVKEAKLADYVGNICFVATSSTPLRLAHLANGWDNYDRNRADGIKISVNDFDRAINIVYKMNSSQRRQNPCIGASRADIFNAACVVFSQIYRDLGAEIITASLKSAVDGIITELQNGTNKDGKFDYGQTGTGC